MSQQAPAMRLAQLIDLFTRSLASFQASGEALRIVYSQPQRREQVRCVVVLDSSFNPPTRVHAGMVRAAVGSGMVMGGEVDGEASRRDETKAEDEKTTRTEEPTRVLLLLAVKNADKAPQPASFPVRLAMMKALAETLQRDVQVGFDIGVTSMPYFHDKARAVAQSGLYGAAPEQVYLAGYDTLVRVFDAKYYHGNDAAEGGKRESETARDKETCMRAALGTFFEHAWLRVFLRPDEAWGSVDEQHAWLRDMVDARWEARVVVEQGGDDLAGVSSSRVREAVKRRGGLDGLVHDGVKRCIEQERLYR